MSSKVGWGGGNSRTIAPHLQIPSLVLFPRKKDHRPCRTEGPEERLAAAGSGQHSLAEMNAATERIHRYILNSFFIRAKPMPGGTLPITGSQGRRIGFPTRGRDL